MVVDFELGWWDVPISGVTPTVVVPADPRRDGVFHVRDRLERADMKNIVLGHCLGLKHRDCRFGQGFVVSVP